MAYVHTIRVRYGECDMQRVVFNANYFAYCDDAVDAWTRHALADALNAAGTTTNLHAIGFDFMLRPRRSPGTHPFASATPPTCTVRCRVGATAVSTC